MHLLSEGSRLRIYHLTAAGVRLQIVFFVCLRGFLQHYIEVILCFITSEVYRARSVLYLRCVNFYFFRNRLGASELQASTNQNMKNKILPGSYYCSVSSVILLGSIASRWSGKEPAFLPSWNLRPDTRKWWKSSLQFYCMCQYLLVSCVAFLSTESRLKVGTVRVTFLLLSNKSFQQHERQDMKSCRVTRMSKKWFTCLDRYAIGVNFISNGTVLATLNLNSWH